jgi:hypothetical protein
MTIPEDPWIAAMCRGDYSTAWAINDDILRQRDPTTRDDPNLPYHLRWVWDGRPFRNRHVLVRCYHGLGDTLQFARYLTPLRSQVASLTVEVQPELLSLLATVPGPDRLIPFAPDNPAPPSECDLDIMELAHALRLPPEIGPPVISWPSPLSLPRGTIGLCWRAGDWNSERSVDADLFRGLTTHPCVALHPSLTHLPVLNPAGCPSDVAGTSALIGGLDLVVTVDTMVAHLAGTQGKPVWLLLKYHADWRWMKGRDDSPWYPSVRLYRQPRPGDWSAVIAGVEADLAARP